MSTTINNIPVYDRFAPPVPTTSNGTSAADLSKNFLKMLTVQLQNQDPMNPMDNAAMTSQLAQLNQVDGINKLNNSVNSLVAQMQSANFMNLSSSVGKTALATGSQVYFSGNAAVGMAAKLDTPAVSLKAVIRDSKSQIVNQFDFGPTPSGTTDFIWNGGDDAGKQVMAGMYTLELTATDDQGRTTSPTSYVGAMVTSIGQEGSDMKVGLSDGRNILTTDIVKWLAI
jgi:flagellar basal-body rod modification protein FlgD